MELCGYPVEKTAAVGAVNMTPNLVHPLEAANPDAPNTLEERFGQRCPAGFNH
jgi:hypothetical protein